MSSVNQRITRQPGNNRCVQTSMNNYSRNYHQQIIHQGHIDNTKLIENMRMLVLNPKELNP